MSVFRTAYDTTACSGFVLTKTLQALQVALANGQVQPIAGAPAELCSLQNGDSVSQAVPAFGHPLQVTDSHKRNLLVVDMRNFGRWDVAQQAFRITSSVPYQLELHRAKLNYIWITERPSILRDVSPMAMNIYANWIGQNVARRFALDPREQMNLTILAAIFYNSLFIDEPEVDERDHLRAVGAISRSLRVTAQDVLAVYDAADTAVIGSVAEFCALAEKASNTIRLKELNVGMLFSILGGTWWSTGNGREMVAVAVEHPPTWFALLLGALSERSYKNTGITQLAERVASKNSGQDFLRSVLNMISTIVGS